MKRLFYCLIILQTVSLSAVNRWFLAFKPNMGNPYVLDDFNPIFPPDGKFYADPMIFKHQGVNYIFFEDYDYRKGVISFVTVDEAHNISAPVKILDLNYHLSFPLIFEEEGHIYMMPETCGIDEIAFYESERFPYEWIKKKVLVPCSGMDSVIFKHNNYYWIITTVDPNQQMLIYYSDHLFSEFKPHPINNLYISERNAGPVFFENGKLIRPIMNSDLGYGHHIIFKEIVTLTPDQFEEVEMHRIYPTWAQRLKGTHTFAFNEDFVVYDGKVVDEPFPVKNESVELYKKIGGERAWMDEHYFPFLEGRVLFVGVAPYNKDHFQQVKNPEEFETIDMDPKNAPYGSPYFHHIEDFLTFEPGYLYDHISMFGVLGRETNQQINELYNIDSQEKITKALQKAHQLLKPNGTLLLGPDTVITKPSLKRVPHLNTNFWYDRLEKNPLDKYEPIFRGIGGQNMIWWGRKI